MAVEDVLEKINEAVQRAHTFAEGAFQAEQLKDWERKKTDIRVYTDDFMDAVRAAHQKAKLLGKNNLSEVLPKEEAKKLQAHAKRLGKQADVDALLGIQPPRVSFGP